MSRRSNHASGHCARLGLAAALGLGLVAVAGCTGKQQAPADGKYDAAPAYKKTTLEGETLELAALQGQVVLLNVWATWCEPCKKELPELGRLHGEHAAEGFTVVAVATDAPRNAGQVRRMVADYELPFPVVHDADNEVMRSFEVVGYPTSFLIGRDGTIRWRRDGMIMDGDPELAEQLTMALAEKR